jgi:two-component system, chemotaxis family, chemotaxis protein CheY
MEQEKTINNTRILLVEDSGIQAKVFVKNLQELGYTQVKCVHKAALALEALNTEPFDLVFCDWNMPEKSGLELLQEIKKDSKISSIPFIMVTAHAEKEKVIVALKNGVADYVVKPITPEIIQEKITSVMGKK